MYERKVIDRIQNIMQHKGVSQLDLAKQAAIPQATMSKILNGKTKMTLVQLGKICEVLKINPSTITSNEDTSFDEVESMYDRIYEINNKNNVDTFVFDTERAPFKGYTGVYHLYSYSTISSETNLLHGIFEIFDSRVDGRCKVSLDLYTGRKMKDDKDVIKKYTGEMIISIPMSTCYCILTNTEIGEMFFLAFHHMFSFNDKITCRMAVGISTSSGGNRRPIAQRILLSRKKLDVEDIFSMDSQFVQGQLRMNASEILISKEEFYRLRNSNVVVDNPQVSDFLEKCREMAEEATYLYVEEAKIRSIRMPSDVKVKGIGVLRSSSIAPKYNKISTKTDEYMFQYIK